MQLISYLINLLKLIFKNLKLTKLNKRLLLYFVLKISITKIAGVFTITKKDIWKQFVEYILIK